MKKDVFDMTDEEFREHLRPTAERVKLEDRQADLPDIYRSELCRKNSEFIREYINGRKELVTLDRDTRTFIVVKILADTASGE